MLPYFPNAHALIVHRGSHGARSDIERGMPEVMQKVFEFLKTGRRQQLPINVELPYKGFPLQMLDTNIRLSGERTPEVNATPGEERQPRGNANPDEEERGVQGESVDSSDFEVWATDQGGTAGRLLMYHSNTLTADPADARPEVVDLAGTLAALCQQQTGTAPAGAHMLASIPLARTPSSRLWRKARCVSRRALSRAGRMHRRWRPATCRRARAK